MRRSIKASRREFQHGLDLLRCYIKPFRYVLDAHPSLKIFKDSGH